MEILFYLLLTLNLTVIFIITINLVTAPKLYNKNSNLENNPLISVLIPARNEENNIANCINSVINQNYSDFEIIILDDESSDNTYAVAKRISEGRKNIKIIKGEPLPKGWRGKNWACNILQQHAKGKYLLFLDADVIIAENALIYSIYLINKYNLDVLSSFPTQITSSFGEKIIVPLMKWLLLSFLPLKLVYSSDKNSLIAANGQYLMFSKYAYDKIGGHKQVSDKIVEDMEFALLAKNNKLKIMTTLGNNAVFCKMYNSFSTAFWGFSKNYFPGFRISYIPFLLLQALFLLVFVSPFFLSIYFSKFTIIAAVILIGRLLLAIITKDNIFFSILMHIIQIIILVLIGINSVVSSKMNRILWKGRKI
jgi:glycosyltransferase involved in cell wall biosynthesis